MNFQNVNDLVPRPSPQPSRVEVPAVPNGPEVPEASLLFDASIRRTEPPKIQSTRDSADRLRTSEDVSIPLYSPSFSGERSSRRKSDQLNCCCGSNSESYRPNGCANTTPTHFDCIRKNQSLSSGYESMNGIHSPHAYSHFSPFMKQCMTDCNDTGNMNQSFVTLDEYQKMASQFTNMILKLNYKFNQVIDNSISREELNQITRKFELKIENLTQRVDELNSKLQRESSESGSRHVAEYKCCQRGCEPVFRRVNEHKCCQALTGNFETEYNENLHISEKSPKQLCPRSSVQTQPDFEHKNPRRADVDELNIDRVHRDRTHLREETQDNLPENVNFRRAPENIELSKPNEIQRQCYPNREHKVPSNNVILTSDLSVLMNTLAMKYIPEGQCESTRQDGMQDYDMIMRNSSNCNNVSMATLQYMERYQLLSSKDRNLTKSIGISKTSASPSNQMFDCQGVPESNDRSFLR